MATKKPSGNVPARAKATAAPRAKKQYASDELFDDSQPLMVSSSLTAAEKIELNKDKASRPYKILDEEQIAKLAAMGASISTIAAFFDVDPNTIIYSYSSAYAKGRETLNLRLQVTQVNVALDGSVPMLIHLGKTRLGQKDTVEIAVANDPNPAVEHIPDDKMMSYLFEVTNATQDNNS